MIKYPIDKFRNIPKRTRIFVVSVVVLLIVVPCSIWLTHHQRNRLHDLPEILKSGRLTVLTDSSRLGFSVNGGHVSGFQYEIVKAFADTLGVELVISEKNDLADCIKDLKNGDYDILASTIPQTTEWKNEVLFTDPLFVTRQVLVQRLPADSTQKPVLKNHLQLAGDTVYIPLNSPYKMRLEHLSDEIADPIRIMEIKDKSTEQMVRLVSKGKIKYTICDEMFAKRLQQEYPNIDISLPIGFEQKQVWAVSGASPKLLEELNDFLGDFIGSSAYWEIYRKYYK